MINALLLYLLVISVIGVLVNLIDKSNAQHRQWRVPEKTLWLVALLGGAPAEYLTMKIIRHKTKHASFMVGMPLLSLLEIAAIVFIILKVTGRL